MIESYREVPAEEGSEATEATPTSDRMARANTGAINVSVPAEAKVYINDRPTTSTGTERRYVSRGLRQGVRYAYEVRAEVERDGENVVDTRVVSLQAGRSARLAFDFAPERQAARTSDESTPILAAASVMRTRLTVNLPSDAQLTLAGVDTDSSGKTRTFSTSRLSEGQTWENYTIVASVVRDGRTLTKQMTIELEAGEDREVTLDFEDQRVAQLAAR
ncbi:MAG: TIGR03000 domain-containing protein [Planctomycetota bacterium]|nr:MAG: TIGR03000 domain-containing protein [Planctomycetota bacterium]REJ94402.1 MAG: TIGR03000 domain-containing protein [Planctomycetota bacterium]REK22065.1 MAG: TIGR03000 domain-containing protein [Planctomycetota bacterium]REK44473.1 MAG: TIGR03000 domain-containing protein [Planctomycetota bacterium]